MKIKNYSELKFSLDSRTFYPAKHPNLSPINAPTSYLYSFIRDAYGYAFRQGMMEYIKDISESGDNYLYNTVSLTFDNKNDLIYLIEDSDSYDSKINTPELDELAEEGNLVELCRRGIADHAVLTKENFLYLLLKWEKIFKEDAPFLLLYLDDKNWYDSEQFDSLESMEKFIADHTDNSQDNIKATENNNIKKRTPQINYIEIAAILYVIVIFLIILVKKYILLS